MFGELRSLDLDVNGIVSQAVNATLTTLKKSPRARLEAGMR